MLLMIASRRTSKSPPVVEKPRHETVAMIKLIRILIVRIESIKVRFFLVERVLPRRVRNIAERKSIHTSTSLPEDG